MDRNFFMAMALSFAVLVMWTMYSESQIPPEEFGNVPSGDLAAPGGPAATAPSPGEAAGASGFAPAERPAALAEQQAAPIDLPPSAEALPERRIPVRTDLFDAEFTTRGAGLLRWSLVAYDDPSIAGSPAVDMTTLGDARLALATPFVELGMGDLSNLDYSVDQPDPRTLVFSAQLQGVTLRKTYLFDQERFVFRLRLDVENGTDRSLRPTFHTSWPAARRESDDFLEFTLAAYRAGELAPFAVLPGPSFLGIGGGASDEPLTLERDVDWAGAQTRYFLAALLPDNPKEVSARFSPVELGESALLELAYTPTEIPPGGRLDREYRVYLGPKEPDRLDAVGGHLDEAILKGWFPGLTRFFVRALKTTYGVVPNYGIAIIFITVVVRLLMAPLMARQMRSMKRMGELQPMMKEVQEKYPDDKQKQSEAMMGVYKEAGVSPFSMLTGCLPMFLQLPVFIGFYYALQGSILLRQQPFFGWIDDLSQPEALFVIPGLDLPVRLLPLLMGGSMFLQQKFSPTTMDAAQARMMLIMMPVMFTLLFYEFASGLVLYWFSSTLLGIGQQILTNRSRK